MAEVHGFSPEGEVSPGAMIALSNYSLGVSPKQYGITGDGTTDDTAAWNTMIGSLPAGSEIVCPPGDTYVLTGPVTIDKPITIKGGSWIAPGTGAGLMVTSSDVTIDGARISSDTSPFTTSQRLIYALGTALDPLERVRVRDVTVEGSRYIAIELSWVKDFEVSGCNISNYQYAGVMVISGKSGVVRGCNIRDALMESGGNSYGIAITDLTNDEAGRSEDIVVDSNYVINVPWEGMDTHGGRRIRFVNNTVENCTVGIALVSGNSSRIVAIEDCVVANNTVAYGVGGAVGGTAVKLHGGRGNTMTPGTAVATGNTVTGFNQTFQMWNMDRTRSNVVGNNRAEVEWTLLPLRDPVWSPGPEPLEYKVDNNEISFRGTPLKNNTTSGTSNAIGVLPEELWPTQDRYLNYTWAYTGNNAAVFRYTWNGVLQVLFESDRESTGGYFPIVATVSLL